MREIEGLSICLKLSKSIQRHQVRISEASTSLMFRIGEDGMEFLSSYIDAMYLIDGVDDIYDH